MADNQELIKKFFTAFSRLDAAGMNECYSNDIVFFDPVFEMLRGTQVRSMWQMLCKNAKNFSLSFDNIQDLGDGYYTADWQASYIFSATGKKVINKARANMRIENGRITEHSDAFSLHKWAAQAMGFSGWLLGWNKFYQQKIKNSAKRKLLGYMRGNDLS